MNSNDFKFPVSTFFFLPVRKEIWTVKILMEKKVKIPIKWIVTFVFYVLGNELGKILRRNVKLISDFKINLYNIEKQKKKTTEDSLKNNCTQNERVGITVTKINQLQ